MVRLLACLLVVLAGSAPALAQQRIFALTSEYPYTTSALWEGHIEGGRMASVRLRTVAPGQAFGDPLVTAGGQFVVWNAWIGTSALVVFDRGSGATHVFAGVPGPGVPDPTRPRLFVSATDGIAVVSASGVVPLPNTAGLTPVGVSPDGQRVYATRVTSAGPPALLQLQVLDADTGASRLSVPLGQAGSVHVASDESAAWVISGAASGALLRKIALPSGDERLSIPLPVAITFPGYSFSHVGVDVSRQRVFVSFEQVGSRYSLGGDIRSFDTETGAEAPRVSLEGWSDAWLDHGAGHVLAFSQSYLYTTGCGEGTLHTVSAATGQELSRVGLGTRVCLTQIGFGTPPRPPTLNAPVVSPARTVTLSWARAPELTLGFTVEAGSAPGLANIATFPVTNLTTLTVPNVPPGTYYVRVRAWNYIGPSVPSNEIVVTVP